MSYEITVLQNGRHLFATAKRSAMGTIELCMLYKMFESRFPAGEGFEMRVTEYQTVGEEINMSNIKAQNGLM